MTPHELAANWIVAPAQAAPTLGGGPSLADIDSTLIRTIVNASAAMGLGDSAFTLAWMGIIAWDGTDSNIIPDFPAPSDGSWDWIWRWPITFMQNPSPDRVFVHDEIHVTTFSESRAMRKLGANTGLLFCLENGSAVEDLWVAYDVRNAYKLPW